MHMPVWTEKEDGAISTILIRGSTDNLMDDIERAVDDGVNTFKVLTRVSNQNTSVIKIELQIGFRQDIRNHHNKKTSPTKTKPQDLVIGVSILNLVCSWLFSCIFPNQLMENTRKSRDSVIVKQGVEITFLKNTKKPQTQTPLHYYFAFNKGSCFSSKRFEMNE